MNRGMRIIGVALAAIFMFSTIALAQGEVKKIAYLDLTKLFDSYEKTKEVDGQLEKEFTAYETERNAKVEKIQELQNKLALMKAEEKEKSQAQMEDMKKDLLALDQAKRTDLGKQRDEKIREILLEIEKVVSDYAKKENYDLVLNDRVLIYGAESMDITEQILTILNEGYKKN